MKVESELLSFCNRVLSLADKLLSNSDASQTQVIGHYLKTKADFLRYSFEVTSSLDTLQEAKSTYQAAYNYFIKLPATHPNLLNVVLSYSVFLHEYCNEPEEAIALSIKTWSNAMLGLDLLDDEDNYKTSTVIMVLLRDNLTLWQTQIDD